MEAEIAPKPEDDPDWLQAQPAIAALVKKIGTAMNGAPMPVCAAALTRLHAILILQAPAADQNDLARAAAEALIGSVADFRQSRH